MALEQAAKSLRKSMKGIGILNWIFLFFVLNLILCLLYEYEGTDETTIIQVVCSHSNRDRQEIKKIFKAKYDKVIWLAF